MTLEDFEQLYAARSNVTVEFLHAHGRYARPCDCDDDLCDGWQMAYVEAVEDNAPEWQQ